MRGQKYLVTAVRRSNGEIVLDKQQLSSMYTGKLRSMPLLRGIIVLIEAMVFGIRSLLFSANVSLEEEDEQISGIWIWVMLAVSMAVAVAIFFMGPLFLTKLFNITSPFLFNIVEGLIRLTIFVIYLNVIGLMPDIKRVFSYHGAEHKTVNGYEAGAPLEVEALKKYSTAHIRCGGSFIFVVLIIAVLVFAMVGLPSMWLMVLSRIILIPVIAGLGYEVIYFGARHSNNIIMKAILAPGLWLQSLTAKPPDDSQLEVAIVALKATIEADREDEIKVIDQQVS